VKVHRVVLAVIDFDRLGADGVVEEIENVRYPNDCLHPTVLSIETRDCGRWTDEHPLNHESTQAAEIERLFGSPDRSQA
jgi:hypothetical protein